MAHSGFVKIVARSSPWKAGVGGPSSSFPPPGLALAALRRSRFPSLQSPLKTLVGSPELSTYPYVEGGFWGNIFTSSPHINACFNKGNMAHSRRALRECATGHLDSTGKTVTCGIINILDSCEKRCQNLNGAGQYYPSCADLACTSSQNIVTTALP